MNFNLTLDELNLKSYEKIIERIAIRAIILDNDQILLMHSNRGDFKFPGGGLEKNESNEECLKREVREETSYSKDLSTMAG